MEWQLIVGIAVVVVLFVVYIIIHTKNKKKKKRRQEMEQIASDKLREEALDRLILNEKVQNDALRASSEQPYQTWYSSSMNTDISKNQKYASSKLMLQVEETGIYSKRSYMLDPEQLISIGSGRENTISLPVADIEPVQCEIGTFSSNRERVYVRNLGRPDMVILIRKRKKKPVGLKFTELEDGDVLAMADVRLKFSFIKTKQGERK